MAGLEVFEDATSIVDEGFNITTVTPENRKIDFLRTQVLFGKLLKVQVVRSTQIYAPFLIWILGTIGSLLAFLVLRRPVYQHSVSTFILKCLCIVNFLKIEHLLVKALIIWDLNFSSANNTICRMFKFAEMSLFTMSSWTLVVLAVGRTVAVYKPLFYKEIFTLKRVKICLALVYSLSLICYCPVLYSARVVVYFDPILGKVTRACQRLNKNYYLYTVTILPWMDFALYSLVPFFILSITSIIIIKQTYIEYQISKQLTLNKNAPSNQNVNINSLLIGNSVAFLILTCPVSIFHVINFFNDISTDFSTFFNSLLFVQVGTFFRDLNSAAMFYMYFISGSRFRNELKLIIKSAFSCDRN